MARGVLHTHHNSVDLADSYWRPGHQLAGNDEELRVGVEVITLSYAQLRPVSIVVAFAEGLSTIL